MRETGNRILLAGGGTGGHLYPGLAVAEAMLEARPETAIAFLTTRGALDAEILAETPLPALPIAARPMQKAPWTWPAFLWSLLQAGFQSRRRFRRFCPEVVIGLGGYGSYPAVRAAQRIGLATMVLNPDIVPGRANRRLARRAAIVCCQFAETLEYFGAKARLTGCPIRPSLLGTGRAESLAALGLDRRRRTLLVTGASSGARTVNRAVVRMLRQEGLPEAWQVLHLTGSLDYETVAAAYKELAVPAVVRAYVHRMGLAYAVADLAVARAGASTVAELAAAGVPTVFMPYPFHRDQHQMRHGRAMEMQGAAVVVQDRPKDQESTWRDLADALRPLLKDEVRLAAMRASALRAARPHAAEAVAEAVFDLADAAARRRQDAIRRDVDNRAPATYTSTGEATR